MSSDGSIWCNLGCTVRVQKAAGGDWELPGARYCMCTHFYLYNLYSAHLPVGPFNFLHQPTNSTATYLSLTEHNINLLITSCFVVKWTKAMSYAKPKLP